MKRTMPAVALTLVIAASCGGDKGSDGGAVQQPAPPVTTPAAPATKAPARPAPPDPAAVAAAELASAARVRTIQVAALPDPETARWWVSHLQGQGIPAYAATATVNGQEVTRLRIGVATTGADARALADRIQARYHWPVWITMVEDRSPVTGAMLVASRGYAGR